VGAGEGLIWRVTTRRPLTRCWRVTQCWRVTRLARDTVLVARDTVLARDTVCHSEIVSDFAFDLSTTYVHLGSDAGAVAIPDFEWTPEFLERYAADYATDGSEGRLVMIGASDKTWTYWERHPAGEELVCVISGRITLVQEIDGSERRIELSAGEAAINPRGVWHTSDVHEPGQVLFVTPGLGTGHRPR